MSLRARLVLAFLLMAVVPLLVVTLFSYVSSQRALRALVQAEADTLTSEMRERMGNVTAELGDRLGRLSDLPLAGLLGETTDDADRSALVGRMQQDLGSARGLIESLEVAPDDAPSPAAGASPAPRSRRLVIVPPPAAAPGAAPAPWLVGRGDAAPEPVEPEVPPLPPPGPGRDEESPVPDEIRRAQAAERRQRDAALREMERETAELARELGREAADAARRALAGEPGADLSRVAMEVAHEALRERSREMKLLLGREFEIPITRDGEQVGKVRAQVRAEELLQAVLARTRRQEGEIPFAVDAEGQVYTPDPDDIPRVTPLVARGGRADEDWIVAAERDESTGLTLGIARPIKEPIRALRRTAMLNLGGGLALVTVALLLVLPLSRRMTSDLQALTEGAERIGRGDLEARVPVRGARELAQLAQQFNEMAGELRRNQEQLVEQARMRKELEISRLIQEELLPRGPLRGARVEVHGVSVPAREVGGDFFNYFELDDGATVVLVGDVSGKGVPAALLMANVQATLRARLPLERDLARLAEQLDRELDATTPRQTYVTLFLAVLAPDGRTLRYLNAGHNTQFLVTAGGEVRPLASTGRPLALLPGGGFEETFLDITAGDCLFLFTDGLVESEDESGEPFGFERIPPLLVDSRLAEGAEVLALVEAAVRAHRGAHEADDDATMVVVKLHAVA